jgi:basic amino acid/polyamine antiporter, APA family
MADQKAPRTQPTLGLTGLTSNAMALIAPGAFLWLTFYIQATTGVQGQPSTAPAMWTGIVAALLLCVATAVAYAEISKLYPALSEPHLHRFLCNRSRVRAWHVKRTTACVRHLGGLGRLRSHLFPALVQGQGQGDSPRTKVVIRLP